MKKIKAKKVVLSVAQYVIIFLIAYVAINLWRSPSAPDQQILLTPNQSRLPSSVLQTSHSQPILVYFWATWCGICGITSPNIDQLHKEGHQVLAVAVHSGTDWGVDDFLSQHNYQFFNINDQEGEIFSAWQGQVTPSFAIIHKGQVEQAFTGVSPLWSLKLRLWWANLS